MTVRIRGTLSAAQSDFEVAGRDYDAAIGIFKRLESRLELGRTLVLHGGASDLQRARELLEHCGAMGDLAVMGS